jgi:adenine/guanine/hypoxanthine permease
VKLAEHRGTASDSRTCSGPPGPNPKVAGWIERFFGVGEATSSLRVELLAGISTFLALSYIFVVNPAILSQAGMDRSRVFLATVLVSGVATIAMGLAARLPFALAPGMEINAYFAYFVVGTLGFSWQQALGCVFWSGVLFVVLTILRVRGRIIEVIPEPMKASLSLSVGVFLALVALKVAGTARFSGLRIVGIGDLASHGTVALAVSLCLILILERIRIPGSVLISIILTTILWHWRGFGMASDTSVSLSLHTFSDMGRFQPRVLLAPRAWSAILVIFLVDFFGSVAKLIGLSANTSMLRGGSRLPRMKQALLVDSIGSTAAAVAGTSSITVYVESGIGIAAGGRTGITAIVCGVLMLSTLGLTAFLNVIPTEATTGALVFVAIKLLPSAKELRGFSKTDLAAIVLMQVTVIATFAIDRAVLVGLLCYVVPDAVRGRWNPYLIGSVVLLLLSVILQLR